MASLRVRQRTFKGADIKRICCKIMGKKEIHPRSWSLWHDWADGILKENRPSKGKADKRNYWVNSERAIVLIAIALIRKDFPRKELDVREVKDRMPDASACLDAYLKYFDEGLVIGRDVREFLEIKGYPRSWTTIRNKIPDFSYTKPYRMDVIIACISA